MKPSIYNSQRKQRLSLTTCIVCGLSISTYSAMADTCKKCEKAGFGGFPDGTFTFKQHIAAQLRWWHGFRNKTHHINGFLASYGKHIVKSLDLGGSNE